MSGFISSVWFNACYRQPRNRADLSSADESENDNEQTETRLTLVGDVKDRMYVLFFSFFRSYQATLVAI